MSQDEFQLSSPYHDRYPGSNICGNTAEVIPALLQESIHEDTEACLSSAAGHPDIRTCQTLPFFRLRIGSIVAGKGEGLVRWIHHSFHFQAGPLFTMIDGSII
ncbi:hypothetical protein [Peribacillus sp. SCS-37]|uniref:hypothetical protein n=1 Tax=Paraperibacillus esterisolvens TaxID=3115296 RepID=UPI0039064D41